MAYNLALEQKLDRLTSNWSGLTKKKMFGGMSFLLNGNMTVGVTKDILLVRASVEIEAELFQHSWAKPMDFTKKVMRGWVFVEPEGWDNDAVLDDIVQKVKAYVDTLPPKKK